jgi:uncharacterized protein YjbJ (UPF0337 family)
MSDPTVSKTKGYVKETTGKVTGDRELEAEGRVESTVASLRQGTGDAMGKARDVAGDAAGKARDVAGDVAGKARDVAGDVAGKARDVAGDATDKAKDMFSR